MGIEAMQRSYHKPVVWPFLTLALREARPMMDGSIQSACIARPTRNSHFNSQFIRNKSKYFIINKMKFIYLFALQIFVTSLAHAEWKLSEDNPWFTTYINEDLIWRSGSVQVWQKTVFHKFFMHSRGNTQSRYKSLKILFEFNCANKTMRTRAWKEYLDDTSIDLEVPLYENYEVTNWSPIDPDARDAALLRKICFIKPKN
jgi:hypothetical protein